MGAIASGGVRLVNHDVVNALGIPDRVIDSVAETERIELDRRERLYRDMRPPPNLTNKIAILVAVGLWYRDFTPTSDNEVRALLGAHR
jgi:predicted phosphoribosyltransferase